MNVLALIAEARAAGVQLWHESGRVRYRGKQEAVAYLLPRLAQCKTEIAAALDREAAAEIPEELVEMARRVCLWRIPGDPVRFVVVGPDDDLREQHPDAVPMFGAEHCERVRRGEAE